MENKPYNGRKIIEEYNVILIRYSEIALKSERVRRRLVDQLEKNIRFQLKKADLIVDSIKHDRGRIYLKTDINEFRKVIDVLIRVFGIYSVSPAVELGIDLDEILKKIAEYAKLIINVKNTTFGIRARKVGKHPFSSRDVAVQGGSLVIETIGRDLGVSVNLTSPDHWIYVEVREKATYIYTDKIPSIWQGNPIYLNRGGLALISGRVSEFVSAFMVMKRGIYVLPLIFKMKNSPDSDGNLAKIIEVLTYFKQYLPINTFYALVIDFDLLRETSFDSIPEKRDVELNCSVCRMLRISAAEWIINNNWEIFEKFDLENDIATRSNLALSYKKKKGKSDDKSQDYRNKGFITYTTIIDGNYFQTARNLSVESQRLIGSSKIPIFRGAEFFSGSELKQRFLRIDNSLEHLLDATGDKNVFEICPNFSKTGCGSYGDDKTITPDLLNAISNACKKVLEKTFKVKVRSDDLNLLLRLIKI